jgi:hypothetical protein
MCDRMKMHGMNNIYKVGHTNVPSGLCYNFRRIYVTGDGLLSA